MKSKVGYVYFVLNAGLVKIGRTNNWKRRYKEFKTTMPYMRVLNVLYSSDMFEKEKYYHKLYRRYHTKGEWYQIPII